MSNSSSTPFVPGMRFVPVDGSGSVTVTEGSVKVEKFANAEVEAEYDQILDMMNKMVNEFEDGAKEVRREAKKIKQTVLSAGESLDHKLFNEVRSKLEEEQKGPAAKELKADLDAEKERSAQMEASYQEQIQQLQQEVELARQEGIQKAEEARQEAWSECEEKYKQELTSVKEELTQVSQQLPVSLNNYLEELEEQMKEEVCHFSLSIVEELLRTEVKRRDLAESVINDVLAPLINYKGVTLFVNPHVAAEAAGGEITVPNGVTVEVDDQLEPGEAYVETSQGIIDGRVERRISTLRESFDKPIDDDGKDSNAEEA